MEIIANKNNHLIQKEPLKIFSNRIFINSQLVDIKVCKIL